MKSKQIQIKKSKHWWHFQYLLFQMFKINYIYKKTLPSQYFKNKNKKYLCHRFWPFFNYKCVFYNPSMKYIIKMIANMPIMLQKFVLINFTLYFLWLMRFMTALFLEINKVGDMNIWNKIFVHLRKFSGELAQVVERSLSMWEVPGSIPGFSNTFFIQLLLNHAIIRETFRSLTSFNTFESYSISWNRFSAWF